MAFNLGKAVIACVIRQSTGAQRTMFNNFLVSYPLFLAAVYGGVYSVAKQALDLGLADSTIDQAFYDLVFACVGENEPE